MLTIAADFETTGLYAWQGDSITHLSLVIYSPIEKSSRCRVYTDHQEMKEAFLDLLNDDCEIVWYNSIFDLSFLRKTWPELYEPILSRSFECMRLRQQMEAPVGNDNYGLKDAVKQFMPKEDDYTSNLKQWCIENNKKGDFRQYLQDMPPDIVNMYVLQDSIMTLKLWIKFKSILERNEVNWREDHKLFMFMVNELLLATDRGIIVDREKLELYKDVVQQDIEQHKEAFRKQHEIGITEIENQMWEEERAKRKTEKGKADVPRPTFNCGSTAQLANLFCDYYHQTPVIRTEKGSPSFKAAHLAQWDGIEELETVGKREIVLTQSEKLLELSSYDGRFHQQLKTCGTITGRYAGGGGLNIQALARRDKGFMSCLVAPEGHSFVSIDADSAEPSIICEYSKDAMYAKIIFGMKGVEPYWEGKTLVLNDVYLSLLSSCAFGHGIMMEAWERPWPCGSFSKQWITDNEVILKHVKKPRIIAKTSKLAMTYGAGAQKIYTTVTEAGFKIEKKDATDMVAADKRMFPGIVNFSKECSRLWEETGGRVINAFNYSAVISSGHKAANFIIQSSVNPIIQFFCREILKACPSALFVTIIHDEIILTIPDSDIPKLKEAHRVATILVNEWLQWKTVRMSFGFAVGKDLYEAK